MSQLQQSHLSSLLGMVTELTEQARAGLGRPSEADRVFLAVYSGFLIETGAGIRWLLEPSLIEYAAHAVRRQAPAASPARADVASRLLATLWASCLLAGVDTEDWDLEAPELPAICVRMAGLVTGEREPES
ncbi:hypothetical protein C9F11_17645 [Streptomyces sp. YIM 121038]|uniref:hypothetical protein n=1 Tax=unclassified Streptomyces TaxID=2593676 RepID=UPI0011108265|nr:MULTISPECIES: hypothetical protein [unclassified Streptomyces]QCX77182.1 hypothetical protein C9F11_17645 [Streptomyces sp. YIM 121038]